MEKSGNNVKELIQGATTESGLELRHLAPKPAVHDLVTLPGSAPRAGGQDPDCQQPVGWEARGWRGDSAGIQEGLSRQLSVISCSPLID